MDIRGYFTKSKSNKSKKNKTKRNKSTTKSPSTPLTNGSKKQLWRKNTQSNRKRNRSKTKNNKNEPKTKKRKLSAVENAVAISRSRKNRIYNCDFIIRTLIIFKKAGVDLFDTKKNF
eukprot:169367_1